MILFNAAYSKYVINAHSCWSVSFAARDVNNKRHRRTPHNDNNIIIKHDGIIYYFVLCVKAAVDSLSIRRHNIYRTRCVLLWIKTVRFCVDRITYKLCVWNCRRAKVETNNIFGGIGPHPFAASVCGVYYDVRNTSLLLIFSPVHSPGPVYVLRPRRSAEIHARKRCYHHCFCDNNNNVNKAMRYLHNKSAFVRSIFRPSPRPLISRPGIPCDRCPVRCSCEFASGRNRSKNASSRSAFVPAVKYV